MCQEVDTSSPSTTPWLCVIITLERGCLLPLHNPLFWPYLLPIHLHQGTSHLTISVHWTGLEGSVASRARTYCFWWASFRSASTKQEGIFAPRCAEDVQCTTLVPTAECEGPVHSRKPTPKRHLVHLLSAWEFIHNFVLNFQYISNSQDKVHKIKHIQKYTFKMQHV